MCVCVCVCVLYSMTLFDEVCFVCVIQVKDRKLKSLPPKPPDPHEQLLQDIRAQPKLKPVKDGRLVGKLPGTALLCCVVLCCVQSLSMDAF